MQSTAWWKKITLNAISENGNLIHWSGNEISSRLSLGAQIKNFSFITRQTMKVGRRKRTSDKIRYTIIANFPI